MKIGKLLQVNIKYVFRYCDEVDQDELARLMCKTYSKSAFNISYPFCADEATIA